MLMAILWNSPTKMTINKVKNPGLYFLSLGSDYSIKVYQSYYIFNKFRIFKTWHSLPWGWRTWRSRGTNLSVLMMRAWIVLIVASLMPAYKFPVVELNRRTVKYTHLYYIICSNGWMVRNHALLIIFILVQNVSSQRVLVKKCF